MMAAWDARGITLGYTVVSDLGDPITVPDGALEGIIANLAIRLNPHFNPQAPISQDVRDQAKVGMDAILSLCVDTAEVSYPETLPQGSGNTYPGYANNTFYPDDQGNILTETGGAIALEEDTEEA